MHIVALVISSSIIGSSWGAGNSRPSTRLDIRRINKTERGETRPGNHSILQVRFLILFPPPPPPPPCPALLPGLKLWRLLFQPCSSTATTVLTARENTSSTPRISLLLHSTYDAFMRLAIISPCSWVTGVRPWVLSSSMQFRLPRRSDFKPTRIIGVVGQKWRTSGYHCTD